VELPVTICPHCHCDTEDVPAVQPPAPSWEFTIPIPLEPANKARKGKNANARHAKHKKQRDAWTMALIVQRANLGIPYPPTGKRRVEIVRVMGKGQRKYDRDNLYASVKACVDAMKPPRIIHRSVRHHFTGNAVPVRQHVNGAHLILDDSDTFLDLDVRQERGGESGVRITITEAV
jgi:hypothetical protein